MTLTIIARNKATGTTRTISPAPLFAGQSTTGPGLPLPTPSADDMVQDLLAHLHSLVPDLPAAVLHQADRYARDMWGGSRPYIAKKAGEGRSAVADAIRRAHAQGLRVGAICRQHQVSRATVYRALGMPDA